MIWTSQNLVKLLQVSAVTNCISCIESKCNRSLIWIVPLNKRWVNIYTGQRLLHFIKQLNSVFFKTFYISISWSNISQKTKYDPITIFLWLCNTQIMKKKLKIQNISYLKVLFKCTLSYLQLLPLINLEKIKII